MRDSTRQRIRERLRVAEEAGSCYVPESRTMRRELAELVEEGVVVEPVRRGFAARSWWDGLPETSRAMARMRALGEMHPEWTFCHVSAALAHGLSVSVHDIDQLHACIVGDTHGRHLADAVRHVVTNDEPVVIGGIRVTSMGRTTIDCLRTMDFPAGLAIADSMLRRTGMTAEQLCELIEEHPRLHGIRQARRTAGFADGRAESGGESIARATMIELGYQMPELQVVMPDPFSSRKTYRADFAWRLPNGVLVIGELDGREKYRNPTMTKGRSITDVLADERLRESRLSATGAVVMRFSYRDVLNRRFFADLLDRYGIPKVGAGQAVDLRPGRRRTEQQRAEAGRIDPEEY